MRNTKRIPLFSKCPKSKLPTLHIPDMLETLTIQPETCRIIVNQYLDLPTRQATNINGTSFFIDQLELAHVN